MFCLVSISFRRKKIKILQKNRKKTEKKTSKMATRGASLKMVKEIHAAFDPFGRSGVTVAR